MTRRYQPYLASRGSGVEWLGAVPEGWEVLPLFRVGTERRLINRDGKETNVLSLSYGRIIRRDVSSGFGLMPDSFDTYQIVQRGDTVLRLTDLQNDQRSLRTGHVPERGVITSAYVCLTPRSAVDDRYFTLVLHACDTGKTFYRMGGGVRQTMRFADLKWLPLPLPPLPEQRAIAAFLDRETTKIDTLVAKEERLLELLDEKRTALISRAVTRGLDPDAPMRDSGVEWLGEVPEGWEVVPLMRLTEVDRPIMYGIVLPGPNVADGVRIVKGGDVGRGLVDLETLNRTTFEIEAGYVRSRLRGGDLVFAIRGSIGEVAKVPQELTGANLTQDAARISVGSEVDGAWLLRTLSARPLFAQLDARASGATIRGINIKDLKRLRVPLAPLPEQHAIAAYLDRETARIDALKAKIQRAIDLLKEYRTALISAAVTGKIDVRGEVAAPAA